MKKPRALHLVVAVCILLAAPAFAQAGELLTRLSIWNAPASGPEADGPLPFADPDAPKGGEIRLLATGAFDNFNPFSPRGIAPGRIAMTYQTLGVDDGSGEAVMRGLVAESFELAPDRSWLIVHLRPEARFSDGHPVSAGDVKFSFEALVREGSPTYRNYYANVIAVEALSLHSVLFRFSETNNRELPLITCQLPVLPEHWWKGRNLGEPQAEAMPGSGPYVVESFDMGSFVTYARVKDWWGEKLPVNRGMYNFDRIRLDYYRSSAVAREAFLAGEADYYVESTIRNWMSAYDVPAAREGKLLREEVPLRRPQGMSGFFFNTRRDVFNDARVRRAIGLCFNFESVNKTLFYGAYRRCNSFFSASSFAAPQMPSAGELRLLEKWRGSLPDAVFGPLPAWPEAREAGFPRSRLTEILALFEEAGWTLKNGKMVNAAGEQLRFTLTLVGPAMRRVAMPLRANLERVGVVMDVEVPDQTQYITRLRQFDYDMIYATVRQSANPGNEQRYFWGSASASASGARNYAGIADPVVDGLVEDVITAPDKEARQIAVHALDRVLQHGFYVLPGWYYDRQHIAWRQDRITKPARHPREGANIASWRRSDSTAAEPAKAGQ